MTAIRTKGQDVRPIGSGHGQEEESAQDVDNDNDGDRDAQVARSEEEEVVAEGAFESDEEWKNQTFLYMLAIFFCKIANLGLSKCSVLE